MQRGSCYKYIDREEIERVGSSEYLGARIQANGKTTPEIRRRLTMATAKLNKMAKVWKGQWVDTTMSGHENQGPKKYSFSYGNLRM